MTGQPPIPTDDVRRLLKQRHVVFARAVREAAGSPTARRVHRSRVAARNLRALLTVLKPWLAPTLRVRARRDLRNMAAEFAESREADVRRQWLGALAASSGTLAPGAYRELVLRLERERDQATTRLRNHLRSEACRSRLQRIDATLQDPGLFVQDQIPDALLRRRVRRRWKVLQRGLARRGTDAAALHALRIAAKKARYASEVLSPLLDLDLAVPMRGLKSLQDALGEHRDATEALDWLDRLGEPLGPVLETGLASSVERVRAKRMKQVRRLAGRFDVPDLAPRAAVSRRPRRGHRSRAGGAPAIRSGGRRGVSR